MEIRNALSTSQTQQGLEALRPSPRTGAAPPPETPAPGNTGAPVAGVQVQISNAAREAAARDPAPGLASGAGMTEPPAPPVPPQQGIGVTGVGPSAVATSPGGSAPATPPSASAGSPPAATGDRAATDRSAAPPPAQPAGTQADAPLSRPAAQAVQMFRETEGLGRNNTASPSPLRVSA